MVSRVEDVPVDVIHLKGLEHEKDCFEVLAPIDVHQAKHIPWRCDREMTSLLVGSGY